VEDGYPGRSRTGVKDVRPRVGVGVESVNRREEVYSARRTQRVERAMSTGDHGTDQRDSSENTANGIAPPNQGKRAEKIEIRKLEMDLFDETQKFAHTFDNLDHESSHHDIINISPLLLQEHPRSTHSFERHSYHQILAWFWFNASEKSGNALREDGR